MDGWLYGDANGIGLPAIFIYIIAVPMHRHGPPMASFHAQGTRARILQYYVYGHTGTGTAVRYTCT